MVIHLPLNIKHLTKNHLLSQTQIAAQLNVKKNTYSNYANGKTSPDFERLFKMCQFYGVDPITFLYVDITQYSSIEAAQECARKLFAGVVFGKDAPRPLFHKNLKWIAESRGMLLGNFFMKATSTPKMIKATDVSIKELSVDQLVRLVRYLDVSLDRLFFSDMEQEAQGVGVVKKYPTKEQEQPTVTVTPRATYNKEVALLEKLQMENELLKKRVEDKDRIIELLQKMAEK